MIFSKIKQSLEALPIPFNYGTVTELDKSISESVLPATFMARMGQSTRLRIGSMICEQANVTIYFIGKDNYGSDSTKIETESISDMQELAETWVKSLQEGELLKISAIKYERIHLGGVKVYSGIGLSCTLRETYGTCVNDI